MLEDLMQQYQQGSLAAFEALYRELAPRVRGYLRAKVRDEARVSDLVQETFLEMHRSRRTYLPGASVAGWTFGIAQNVVLRHRRVERRRAHEVAVDDSALDPQLEPRASDFELQPLADALHDLPAEARDTWWMRNIEGLSFETIASRLGIAAAAVRLRCSRASRALRAALERGSNS